MTIINKNENCAVRKTSIGGQALIEGVMMRGPINSAMAIRQPNGEIHTEQWQTFKDGKKKWYSGIPLVRGIFNFVTSLADGYKCLMRSADIAGFDEEPTAFEKKLMNIFGEKFSAFLSFVAVLLGTVIALGLFVVMPTFLVGLLGDFITTTWARSIAEGLCKIALFVLYLAAVSKTSDMKRLFQYHGAEHKTIACYEAGEELTPQNVAKHTRFHPRCGTSFILIVLVVSIIVFSVVTWDDLVTRVALKVLMMPLVVGIAYEIIRLAGRYNNPVTRFISAPGLWLQNLTTNEPDLEQIAVAIASMKPCIPQDGSDNW